MKVCYECVRVFVSVCVYVFICVVDFLLLQQAKAAVCILFVAISPSPSTVPDARVEE